MTEATKLELSEEIARLEKECEAAWNEVCAAETQMAPFKKVANQATQKWFKLNEKVQGLKGLL
jgi:hypothetical protein